MNALVVPINSAERLAAFLEAWAPWPWDRIMVVHDAPEAALNVPPRLRDAAEQRLEVLGWAEIDSMLPNPAIISRQDSAIRSFGFWRAWAIGAQIIFTMDDDCYPTDDALVEMHRENLYQTPAWTSSVPGMRVRGLPYRNSRALHDVQVSMGLLRGSPDLDAMTTLAGPDSGISNLGAQTRVMPSHQYFPMSGMNLAFRREVACLMYFAPMGRGQPFARFDDIWCGLVVHPCGSGDGRIDTALRARDPARGDDILADREVLAMRFAGKNAVIHLAGIPHPQWPGATDADFLRLNYDASVRVFEAARDAQVPVFVFASSAQVYRINDPVRLDALPIRESNYLPLPAEGQSTYGFLKAAFERYLAGACTTGTTQAVALRLECPGFRSTSPSNLYVSTSIQNLIGGFSCAAAAERPRIRRVQHRRPGRRTTGGRHPGLYPQAVAVRAERDGRKPVPAEHRGGQEGPGLLPGTQRAIRGFPAGLVERARAALALRRLARETRSPIACGRHRPAWRNRPRSRPARRHSGPATS